MEIRGPEIFWATVSRVTAGDIDSPEVIIRERQTAKTDSMQSCTNCDDAAIIILLDLLPLSSGNSQQGSVVSRPMAKRSRSTPEAFAKLVVVDLALLLNRTGMSKLVENRSDANDAIDVDVDQPREPAGRTTKIEGTTGIVEEIDPTIPIDSATSRIRDCRNFRSSMSRTPGKRPSPKV